MATDKSEPRTGLIFKIGLIAVIILVTIRGGLMSYFDNIARAEEHRKYGEIAPTALLNLREDEKQRLASGPMPIDKAMQDLVTKGRMAASPDIMPSASRDVGALQGWSKMPGEVPPPMMAPAAPADAGAPGAEPAAAGDAGAQTPERTDGGAPKKTHNKK